MDRRQIVYLLLLGVGVFILLPRAIGFERALRLLLIAHPAFVLLALAAETLRYIASAMCTIVLARIFDRRVPLLPMTEAFFAGAALNRTFSAGGAAGMLIRIFFLGHLGIPAGSVAVIFLIEDIAGLIIGALVLSVGIVTISNALPPGMIALDLAIASLIATPLILLGGWFLYRRRAWVERAMHALAPIANRPMEWIMGRPVFTRAGVQRALDDFYAGARLARRAPVRVVAAFALNVVRYALGAAALYFAFLAMNQPIAPGALILIYTAASTLSTVSALPGEVALMGASFALLSLSFDVPREVAVMALLLSRAIAFWFPLLVGYVAFGHLRKRHDL
jgi:uncharacterized protein (TIRG00374 family)